MDSSMNGDDEQREETILICVMLCGVAIMTFWALLDNTYMTIYILLGVTGWTLFMLYLILVWESNRWDRVYWSHDD